MKGSFHILVLLTTAASAALGALPLRAAAQEREEWEGQPLQDVLAGTGWTQYRFRNFQGLLEARKGKPYTREMRDRDHKTLFARRLFSEVRIEVKKTPDGFAATVDVVEYPRIVDVVFSGANAVPPSKLLPNLSLRTGDVMNPYLLKVDEEYLRGEYLPKGYAFFQAVPEQVPTEGGVILHWQISEGPIVRVDEVRITGLEPEVEEGVKRILLLQGSSTALGFIPTPGQPFVERFLEEDLKRIRLHLYLAGWLDIAAGERVFVKDLRWSRDKTLVTIDLHVDPGERYRIREIEFKGNTIFTTGELAARLVSKVGGYYSENDSNADLNRIREMYGERAYITTQVEPGYVVAAEAREVRLRYTVTEGEEIVVGRIVVQGNSKTRFDVILRELRDFVPGEKFNNTLLSRGLQRLRDKQYFEPDGLAIRTEPGSMPNERDVVIDVKEGTTGNIRFAGGYSSSFGILGIIEFTQRNFDLGDLPKSFEDLVGGTAFAGGGQFLRLRAAPAAQRQTFLVEFGEPYVFGYEFSLNTRAAKIVTERRSWSEDRRVGRIGVGKRWGRVGVDLAYELIRIELQDIDADAPTDVFRVEGINYLSMLQPSVAWDTRDSLMFPSEGHRLAFTYTLSGGPLGGDWDFHRVLADGEIFFTLHETENKRRHVVKFDAKIGWAEPFGDSDQVPLFDNARFYAGGRDSIRGFEFRGIGPRELGEAIGGTALVQGSVEYQFPLLSDFLRGALFYDVANLTADWDVFSDSKFRHSIGFGFRFIIPQLGNIPVALDFGFALEREDFDERQTVTFDLGRLF